MVQDIRAQSRFAGVKKVYDLGALANGAMVQAERDSGDLKVINRQFGYLNFITVINNSTSKIFVDLDFTTEKRFVVPSGSMITVDSVMYQELNVTNAGPDAITAGQVYVSIGYERPLMREPPVAKKGIFGV